MLIDQFKHVCFPKQDSMDWKSAPKCEPLAACGTLFYDLVKISRNTMFLPTMFVNRNMICLFLRMSFVGLAAWGHGNDVTTCV